MASHEVPLVRTVESRLRDLIPEARALKTQLNATSLHDCKSEPGYAQLQAKLQNIFTSDAPSDDIASTTPVPITITYHHTILEAAARNLLYFLLSEYAIDSPEFDNVWCLLDILILCTSSTSSSEETPAPQCDASLPLWLIEELFDSQTIVGCRRVFDYLESSWHFLLHATGMDKGTGITNNMKMILLRTCNELLRRLSRAEDAVFCGRIFMFLFASFPLGDKSSVNLRGDFHVENTTVFDDVSKDSHMTNGDADVAQEDDHNADPKNGQAEEEKSQDQVDGEAGKMDVDGVEGEVKQEISSTANGDKPDDQKPSKPTEENQPEKSSGPAVAPEAKTADEEQAMDTDTFYTIFWSLQHVFSNPIKLFEQEEFQKFKNGLEMTLEKFKATPKVLQTHGTPRTPGENKRGLKRRRSRVDDQFASNFNPKYLTSRDLFELELSDMTFQRHILVQALILIDFLLSLTPKAKKKLGELKAQRAMQYNYTLSEDDTKWASSTRAKVASYLQEGPDGKFYYRMADTVLARDKNWVRWKVESCPPIERDPMATKDFLEAENGARRACALRRNKAIPEGAVDIEFLSDVENVNHLGTLKDPEQFTIPAEDQYLREIETIDLDLEMAADEEKPYMLETKASAIWRTLRLVSKHRLDLFDKVDENDGLKAIVEPPKADEPEEVPEEGTTQEFDPQQPNDVEQKPDEPSRETNIPEQADSFENSAIEDIKAEEPNLSDPEKPSEQDESPAADQEPLISSASEPLSQPDLEAPAAPVDSASELAPDSAPASVSAEAETAPPPIETQTDVRTATPPEGEPDLETQ